MSVLALEHVNIAGPAELIERVRDFYVTVIGLIDGFRPPFQSRGFWLYAGDVAVIHLRIDDAQTATGAGALDHFALQCDELEPLLVRLRSAGIPWEQDSVPGAGITQIFVRDPAGVGVELSFRTRSSA